MTRNLEAPRSSGLFRGSELAHDSSESQPSTCETQEKHEYVSCRRDMTEIMFKTITTQYRILTH